MHETIGQIRDTREITGVFENPENRIKHQKQGDKSDDKADAAQNAIGYEVRKCGRKAGKCFCRPRLQGDDDAGLKEVLNRPGNRKCREERDREYAEKYDHAADRVQNQRVDALCQISATPETVVDNCPDDFSDPFITIADNIEHGVTMIAEDAL